MFRVSVGFGALLALGACSTVIKGTTQDIEVKSTPVSQADCTLSSGDALYRVTTPGTVEVARSGRSLDVACSKEGYQEGHATLDSSFNGVTFGNILLGGVIGIAADAMSGANNSYPHEIVVALQPLPGEAPADEDGPSMPDPSAVEPETAPSPSAESGSPMASSDASAAQPMAAPGESAGPQEALQQRLSSDLAKLRGRINVYGQGREDFASGNSAAPPVREVLNPQVVSLEANRARVEVDLVGAPDLAQHMVLDLVLLGEDYAVVGHEAVL
jgi:hypothetical protein